MNSIAKMEILFIKNKTMQLENKRTVKDYKPITLQAYMFKPELFMETK